MLQNKTQVETVFWLYFEVIITFLFFLMMTKIYSFSLRFVLKHILEFSFYFTFFKLSAGHGFFSLYMITMKID